MWFKNYMNLYVDDRFASADIETDASHMFTETKDEMGKAGIELENGVKTVI